ncbi:WXG100 family type VII secretion target [Kutzneria viridogrisea]|uniref:Uncharacterized protein YukE n=1 Tax=Kutzneria viridogrisea TaxID=47990 RepID=A0ABR6B826_9PSEU|nr:uncharacterized protein YukE [Kutzneria viridogrisea]
MTGKGHGPRTNFAQYSHEQLYTMLFASQPETVSSAAQVWDSTGKSLHDNAGDLESQLRGFQDKWRGGAAEQYRTMITDLAQGIRKVADTAFAMRDLTNEAGDSLGIARARMPKPVNVPQVPPSVLSLATTQITVQADTPPQVVAQMQQQQSEAIAAIRNQQQAAAASDAAHAQAVAVMNELAGDYATAESSIPPSPNADQVPNPGQATGSDPGTASGAIRNPMVSSHNSWDVPGVGATTLPAGTTQVPTSSPLFGGMFTAGLGAASAAAFGRFGSIMPKLPPFLKQKQDEQKNGAKSTGTPKLGDSVALKGGGGIGGGAGGIGGGIGGGTVPSANASMVAGGSPGAAGAAALGAVAAEAAGAKGMGGPMMPMMPMSGAGAGDMGNGKRIPPWLVETEDVWGESSAVTPGVIGEDL